MRELKVISPLLFVFFGCFLVCFVLSVFENKKTTTQRQWVVIFFCGGVVVMKATTTVAITFFFVFEKKTMTMCHCLVLWCYCSEKGDNYNVFEKKKKMTTMCHHIFVWWCSNKEGDNNLLPLPSSLVVLQLSLHSYLCLRRKRR